MATHHLCKIAGCGNVGKLTRGWCQKHYQRWQSTGDPLKSKIDREQTGKPCRVQGCERGSGYKGFCELHYDRWKRTGDPLVASADPNHHKVEKWLREHAHHVGEECLRWPFNVCEHGRGTATLNGRQMSAPKVMCVLAHGEPPSPAHEAAHSCGKGHEGCINPNHLRWATRKENEADKLAHGTLRRGMAINTAKLNENDVRAIRASADGLTALSSRYGISATAVWNIRRRKSWTWLD